MSDARDYTWAAFAKELALSTPATLADAVYWRMALEPTGWHPHDALPVVVGLLNAGSHEAEAALIAKVYQAGRDSVPGETRT